MGKRTVTNPTQDTETTASAIEVVRVAPATPRRTGDGYALLGLLAGAVCGAVAGLLLAPRKGNNAVEQLLGKVGMTATPSTTPAEAQDAVAQIMQYSAPGADENARPPAPTATATAPAATAQE
jgi:hypothetical protein